MASIYVFQCFSCFFPTNCWRTLPCQANGQLLNISMGQGQDSFTSFFRYEMIFKRRYSHRLHVYLATSILSIPIKWPSYVGKDSIRGLFWIDVLPPRRTQAISMNIMRAMWFSILYRHVSTYYFREINLNFSILHFEFHTQTIYVLSMIDFPVSTNKNDPNAGYILYVESMGYNHQTSWTKWITNRWCFFRKRLPSMPSIRWQKKVPQPWLTGPGCE